MSLIPIKDIHPNPFQVRTSMDPERLKELAAEIKATGMWKGAIRARRVDDHYELVFGHRRLEALKLLGEKHIDIEIVELDDTQMATQALVENLQREGLTDVEKANGIKRLMQISGKPLTQEKVAKLLGFSQSTIKDFMSIAGLDADTQRKATEARLPRMTIIAAQGVGGSDFVKIAAKEKLSTHEVRGMQSAMVKLKDADRRKIKERLVSGKLKPTADGVKREARKLKAKAQPREKIPPDLHEVLIKWTGFISQWRLELKQVAPYREYIDTDQVVAEMFRKQVKGLIENLEALL